MQDESDERVVEDALLQFEIEPCPGILVIDYCSNAKQTDDGADDQTNHDNSNSHSLNDINFNRGFCCSLKNLRISFISAELQFPQSRLSCVSNVSTV